MNEIHLVGHISRDPELNFIPNSGTAVVKFGIAVNRPHFDKSKPQEADFFNCTMFGKKAETIANYVKKGHLFGVSGSVEINKYVDKNGENRQSIEVKVKDFDLLQPKGNSNSAPSQSNSNNSQSDPGNDNLITPIDDGDIPF